MGELGDERLGPNLGHGRGAVGDCIHVLAPGERELTLCGHPVGEVTSACSMDTGYKPGEGAGCWTCLEESNGWAAPRG